jgi:3-isopropylmalate/(R)-2-methylmalate dehydratase large subunit
MTEPRTFFEKVWSQHVIADCGDNAYLLQVDRLVLHELSGSVTLREALETNRRPDSPDQVFTIIDHVLSTRPGRGMDEGRNETASELIRFTRKTAREMGTQFIDVDDHRQGIGHVISPEFGIALPGLIHVSGDSHTATVGGIGALAWGIGSSEGIHILATQTIQETKPKTMRVRFEGELPSDSSPKDMILHLIGEIGANGGIGYAVEFAGEVVRKMPVEGRLTLCNMAIEFSAKFGFVPPDETTIDYFKGVLYAPKGAGWDRAVAHWRTLASDEGAVFDKEIVIDCSAIEPQVTWGTSPQQVLPITGAMPDPESFADAGARTSAARALEYHGLKPGTPFTEIPIDAAYIGACTNARLSDLRKAAAILKGHHVAKGVQAICVPGSTKVKKDAEAEGIDKIFIDAGFEWLESSCAMCGNGGAERLKGLRVISTTNRNFEGRQGPGTKTHLASPETVAASALAGRIADHRKISQ